MKKLIITDDLQPLISSGKSILARKNIEIFPASSGEDLLRIHSEVKADLIIMGLSMTGIDGDEISTTIRSNASLKKVSIVIICDDDKAAIARCQACSANAFIAKPVDPEDVFRHIRKFLYVSDRKNLRVIFQVFIKGQVMDRFFFANTENISSSGILLETDEMIEIGERATFSFFLGQDLTTLNGKIVRVSEKEKNLYYYGVQFININLTTQKRISDFISEI